MVKENLWPKRCLSSWRSSLDCMTDLLSGPEGFPAATSVATVKESILAQWPKGVPLILFPSPFNFSCFSSASIFISFSVIWIIYWCGWKNQG